VSVATPVQDAPARTTSWRERLPDATPALLAYAAVRIVGLLVLLAFHGRYEFFSLLYGGLDNSWYQAIAENGYDSAIPLNPDGSFKTTNLAFFPLYPGLVAALHWGLSIPTRPALLMVSWPAAIAAAWGIYAVGRHVRSHATGVLLAALWGVVPSAVVESMGYSESLFTALAAWSLYALLKGRWVTAGVLILLAGLTRPTALALIVVIGVAALIAIVKRRDGWRPWVAAALAPLGYLGYLAFVAIRLGRFDGYYYVQEAAWHNGFDWGLETYQGIVNRTLLGNPRLAIQVVTGVLILAVGLFAWAVRDRLPWPLLTFCGITIVQVILTATAYHGKARYMLPLFPLLFPIADRLKKAPRPVQVGVLLLFALISGAYGVYLRVYFRHSP